jgi:hypothetical protein
LRAIPQAYQVAEQRATTTFGEGMLHLRLIVLPGTNHSFIGTPEQTRDAFRFIDQTIGNAAGSAKDSR